MFLVEPDKLDIKTLTWVSVYYALLGDLMAKRQRNEDAVLFEFADVANTL